MKKSFLKSKNKCKVTFTCPGDDAATAHLVGDFNDWDYESIPMKKGKNGFTATLELEPGRAYQYRYLLDRGHWQNDQTADYQVPSPYPDAQNSVIEALDAPLKSVRSA
ncbi:MAG: isoamylase early set domain-containing protein [Pseudomonadota bacterium]